MSNTPFIWCVSVIISHLNHCYQCQTFILTSSWCVSCVRCDDMDIPALWRTPAAFTQQTPGVKPTSCPSGGGRLPLSSPPGLQSQIKAGITVSCKHWSETPEEWGASLRAAQQAHSVEKNMHRAPPAGNPSQHSQESVLRRWFVFRPFEKQ